VNPDASQSEGFGYIEEMPEDIRDIFLCLCRDTLSLGAAWALYKRLFLDPEARKLLDLVSRGTFKVIGAALWSNIIILFGRLGDDRKGRGDKENICFRSLVARVQGLPGLSRQVGEFIKRSKAVKFQRNKLIAHNDLNARTSPLRNPIPKVTAKEIDELVKMSGAILNDVARPYSTELAFDWMPMLAEPEYLLRLIRRDLLRGWSE
jgi:hypothetical protein